ncbi:MAG: hypothetical protein AAGD11_15390 [Planctomycetota bacterium]
MPHFPKPFYRKSRGLWYVELNGKQVNLGPDQDDAFSRYHELLAAKQVQQIEVSTSDSSVLVAVLCGKFLGWTKKHRAEDTYEWYRRLLQQFVSRNPELLVYRQSSNNL